MMATEVHWFPNIPNEFLVSGAGLKLYQVPESADRGPDMEDWVIHVDKSIGNVKCCSPGYAKDEAVAAVGLSSGKLMSVNFQNLNRTVEHVSKSSKTINCLKWKGQDPRVAVGFDRSKEDCINLWDTEKNVTVMTFGGSDSAISLSWDIDFKMLFVGVGSKAIKMFDLRQGFKEVSMVATRAVQGIEMAFCDNGSFFSSFADNVINYYDLRSFDQPLLQMSTSKPVVKTKWNQGSRKLSALLTESKNLHIYGVHWSVNEPYCVKHKYQPFGSDKVGLIDVAWSPMESNSMLCLDILGELREFKIPESIPIKFDNESHVISSAGEELNFYNNPVKSISNDIFDISRLMKERALRDYGQIADIEHNGYVACDPNLAKAWTVLASMYSKGLMLGLKSILGLSTIGEVTFATRSETQYLDWYDFPSYAPLKTYKSEPRQLCQALCGWNFDRNNDETINSFLENEKGNITKCAFVACSCLKIQQAVDILLSSDDNFLKVAAVAIGSFNAEHNFAQKDIQKLCLELNDPYLRAIFRFLNLNESQNWDNILKDSELPLTDRMAFACYYLSDSHLQEHVKRQISSCIESGDLSGILLTGTTNDGVTLLQSYLNITEDVQTVALIASRFFTNEQISNNNIQFWISTYRNLLDAWGFWTKRAQFDIMMGNKSVPPRTVYLLCNFCGKSVSAAMQEDHRIRGSNRLAMACPHCKKPMPRCSLCLLHIGTSTSGLIEKSIQSIPTSSFQAKPFGGWFTWCQTCRHGGHAAHLKAWFAQYSECPVTLCDCNCLSRDLLKKAEVTH